CGAGCGCGSGTGGAGFGPGNGSGRGRGGVARSDLIEAAAFLAGVAREGALFLIVRQRLVAFLKRVVVVLLGKIARLLLRIAKVAVGRRVCRFQFRGADVVPVGLRDARRAVVIDCAALVLVRFAWRHHFFSFRVLNASPRSDFSGSRKFSPTASRSVTGSSSAGR